MPKKDQDSPSAAGDDDQSPMGEDTVEGRKQINRENIYEHDVCHRLKMKCIGKETPPCTRCRQTGHSCTFDGPRKSKGSRVEDRLKTVEGQMGAMQSALEELVRMQRAALPVQQQAMSQHSANGHSGYYPQPSMDNPSPHTTLSLHNILEPQHNRHMSQTPSSHAGPSNEQYMRGSRVQPQWPPSARSTAKRPASPNRSMIEHNISVPESEDEDDADPLNVSAMGAWDNMFSLAEAARLEQDGQAVKLPDTGDSDSPLVSSSMPTTGASHPFDYHTGDTPGQGPSRKKRKASKLSKDDFAELKRNLPLQRGDHVNHFRDCIEEGFCTVEKAREMYHLFMDGCSVYMPCFDPEIDTFESLRKRSPFSITALVMVGAKVCDAGGPVSDLQRLCRQHAEKIGASTLFTPVAKIEVVQAMIVLSSWGDTSWRPGGHAIRMAMDMGLYRCLPLLAKGKMGKGKNAQELKEEYPLVVGARVWLTLFKMEYEMAFNLGRPTLFAGDETIRHCKEFLDHPLSIETDSRIVAACELLSARVWLHQPFAIIPTAASIPDMDKKLEAHQRKADEWFEYWNKYYESRGVEKGMFLREALITGRCGAELYANSRILHGVRNRLDVESMPPERKQRLVKARDAAQTLLEMCLRGQQYKKNFRFANLYTHVNIAFAARCLIRLTSLIPEGLDTRQVGRDVEKVAQVLTQVPGFQYATFLRDVLSRARRQRVLPPPTRPPSPARNPTPSAVSDAPFGSTPPNFTAMGGPTTTSDSTSAGFNFGISPADAGTGFDFGYAEQLFNQPLGQTTPSQNYFDNNLNIEAKGFVDQGGYNLDSWFPFPPLESESSVQGHAGSYGDLGSDGRGGSQYF